MNAVHIISSLANEAAGPSYSVRRLAESVRGDGFDSAIYTTCQPGASAIFNATAFDLSGGGFGLGRTLFASASLRGAIKEAAQNGDILHSHGLWLLPNLYPAQAAAKTGTRLISSPRGMLAPEALEFSKYKKRIMWAIAQKRALEVATCLHATSEQEAWEIRAAGLKNPIAVIPNGIDVPSFSLANSYQSGLERTVLYLGRIHPKKGIDQLIRAWAQIEPHYTGWRLRIIGPSEGGHVEALQALTKSLGLRRVQFEGPAFGLEKERAYREAALFVLPTRNENFGLVVAEALAAGTPVICTRGAPWQGLELERCGWWIEYGALPLANALSTAMAVDRESLFEMGRRGRAWMVRDFSWVTMGDRMRAVYHWMTVGGSMPSWVTKA